MWISVWLVHIFHVFLHDLHLLYDIYPQVVHTWSKYSHCCKYFVKNNEYWMWAIKIEKEEQEDIALGKSVCLMICIQFLESFGRNANLSDNMLSSDWNVKKYSTILSLSLCLSFSLRDFMSVCCLPPYLSHTHTCTHRHIQTVLHVHVCSNIIYKIIHWYF